MDAGCDTHQHLKEEESGVVHGPPTVRQPRLGPQMQKEATILRRQPRRCVSTGGALTDRCPPHSNSPPPPIEKMTPSEDQRRAMTKAWSHPPGGPQGEHRKLRPGLEEAREARPWYGKFTSPPKPPPTPHSGAAGKRRRIQIHQQQRRHARTSPGDGQLSAIRIRMACQSNQEPPCY